MGKRPASSPRKSRAGKLRGALYTIAQATWGFPQTLAGFTVFAKHAKRPHFRFHGAIVTTWESRKALSLGLFLFMHGPAKSADPSSEVDRALLVHEYGHSVQSLLLGPAYLLCIGLPSVIWLNTPALRAMRRRAGTSYYAFYTERSANWLGERALGEKSVGQAMID